MSTLETPVPTRYPVFGQFTGKVMIICPKCGRGIMTRSNWNTWKIQCRGCESIMIIGIIVRIPARNQFKRKYVRPIDTVLPAATVFEWASGEPANCLLSGDDD